MNILEQLAEHARERVEYDKKIISEQGVIDLARSMGPANGEAFYKAIAKPDLGVICEIKKASPSKGMIDPVFDYMAIALEYELAGADAISCLTEPKWFLGSDAIFMDIRVAVKTPMLRKDFVVDPYQLYQARCMGADCVLLICSLLDTETIRQYLDICERLGLAALVEAHNEEEIRSAVKAGARMIGVNNRNLKDFTVDAGNSLSLRKLVPEGVLFIAESGIKTAEDAAALRRAGVDACLVGETLMRAPDRKAKLQELRGAE
jgi:indole-3-glycerol phosphate synthase